MWPVVKRLQPCLKCFVNEVVFLEVLQDLDFYKNMNRNQGRKSYLKLDPIIFSVPGRG